jgi:hypothetical protein
LKEDISSDSEEELDFSGVTENQRDQIMKDAIRRECAKESFSQMGRKDRDRKRSKWIASQFVE